MSEQAASMQDTPEGTATPAPYAGTAGQMIKAARTANGVHIAALAASIKVSVRKLELLESDRIDELPDATFARALAQTVCRFLKVDPAPILAKLPEAGPVSRLEHVAQGLNQPFRDAGGGTESFKLDGIGRPAVWVPLLLVLAAIVLWLLPPELWSRFRADGETSVTATGASAPVLPPNDDSASAAETVHSAPIVIDPSSPAPAANVPELAAPLAPAAEPAVTAPAADATPAAAANAALVLRTTAESWVEVQDARGRTLISRLLAPNETVGLEGSFPMRVRIGNAGGTQVSVRGQAFDMSPYLRDNVARFDVK